MSAGVRFVLVAIFASLLLFGCASHRTARATPSTLPTTHLSDLARNADVEAYVAPPIGWNPEPLKSSTRHTHQVWLAPSGSTAYGIIKFALPIPVGTDLVLW